MLVRITQLNKVNACYLEYIKVRLCHFDMHHFDTKMKQVLGFAYSHHFDIDVLLF